VNEGVSNINTRNNEFPTANESKDMHNVRDKTIYNGLLLKNTQLVPSACLYSVTDSS
jgi:hypothetical protein